MSPLLHTPVDAAERLRCGRTTIYELMRSGELESITVGRLRRIPEQSLLEYIERQRAATRKVAA